MSTSVDNRVVRLQFDNAQFEKETARSMSTLDKLKAKLNFSDSAKEFDKLQTSVNNVDFSAMEKSLKFLEDRFSATGEFVYKIWDKITDKAINSFRSIEQMTIGQIKSGGWSRAMNLANAQFQVEGLKYSWEKIFAAADYGVTDTAYGLDAAAKAASQLAASGVDFQKTLKTVDGVQLTQMHKSLRAISGLAAMTNSSYEEISHIFTRIAGTGRVFAIDLNSIAARGINATATLAKHLKTTEANVKEMVTKGQIDFKTFAEAMDEAYGEHAKEANNTFNGALSNMRAALSRIGAIFAQPVINKTNTFFNAITGKIKEVQKALSDVKDAEGRVNPKFATHFAEAWTAAVEAAVNFTNAIDMSWIKNIADTMDRAAIKMKKFFDYINEGFKASAAETKEAQKETKDDLKNMVATQAEYNAAMTILFKDRSLSGKKRVQWLEKQGLNPKRVQKYIDSVVAAGYHVKKASIKVEKGVKDDKDAVDTLEEALKKLPMSIEEFHSKNYWEQKYFLQNNKEVAKAYTNYNEWLGELMEKQDDARARTEAYNKVNEEYARILGKLPTELKLDFNTMSDEDRAKIYQDYPQLFRVFSDGFKQAKEEPKKMSATMEILQNVAASVSNVFKNLKTVAGSVKMAFKDVFTSREALDGVARFTGKFREMTEAIMITSGGSDKIRSVFVSLFKVVRYGISLVGKLAMKFMDLVIYIATLAKSTKEVNEEAEESTGILSGMVRIFKEVGRGIYNIVTHIGELGRKIRNTEGVQRLIKAFTNLKDILVTSAEKAIKPASKEFDKLSKKFKFPSIDDIANAIGWIADKIAWFIEKLPVAIGVIKSVFSTMFEYIKKGWNYIQSFFANDVASGSKSFFEKVRDALFGAWEWTTDMAAKVGGFFVKAFDYIKSVVGGIDIDTVKKVGQFALIMAGIYEILSIADSTSKLIRNIADVPKAISTFIKGMSKAAGDATQGFKYFGMAAIINALTGFFGAFTVLVGALALMPEDDMYRALAAVVIIGFVIKGIMKAIGNILNEKNTVSAIKEKSIQKINIRMFDAIGQLAMLIGAVALAAKWILGAYQKLLDAMKDHSAGEIAGAAVMIAVILAAVFFAVYKLSSVLTNMEKVGKEVSDGMSFGGKKKNKITTNLMGIAVVFIAIGYAVKTIIKAITSAITQLTLVGKLFSWDLVIKSVILIGGIFLAIGGAMALIGLGVSLITKNGKDSNLLTAALMIGIMFIGIELIMYRLAQFMEAVKGTDLTKSSEIMTKLIVAMIVVFGGMAALVAVMAHFISKSKDLDSGDMVLIAGSVVILAAAFLVFAKAMQEMMKVDLSITQIGLLIGFVAVLAGLGLLVGKVKGFADGIVALGTALLLAGAGFYLFAHAGEPLAKALVYIAQGLAALSEAITPKLLIFMATFAVILYSISRIIKPIADGIGKGISGIGTSLTKAFGKGENGEGGIFSTILKNIKGFLKNFKKDVITPIGKGIKNIFTGENGIITKLKNGLEKVGNWFSGLSDKTKKTVLAVIGGLLLALETAAPDAVKSFIKVLLDIVDTIADHAVYIVDRLIQLIVTVIIALAQAISRNAHIIGNAVKAVFLALLTIIFEIIAVVSDMAYSALSGVPILGDFFKGLSEGMRSSEKKFAKSIQEISNDTKQWLNSNNDEYKKYKDTLDETSSGMFNVMDIFGKYSGLLQTTTGEVKNLTAATKEYNSLMSGEGTEQAGPKREMTDVYGVAGGKHLETVMASLTKEEKDIYEKYKKLKGEEAEKFRSENSEIIDKILTAKEADEDFNTRDYGNKYETALSKLSESDKNAWNNYLRLLETNNGTAAEEFRKSNRELIDKMIQAQEDDMKYYEAWQNTYSRTRAEDLLSSWVEQQTGQSYDFSTMSQAQRDVMFKELPGLKDAYEEAMHTISQYGVNEEDESRAMKVLDSRRKIANGLHEETMAELGMIEEENAKAKEIAENGWFGNLTSTDFWAGVWEEVDKPGHLGKDVYAYIEEQLNNPEIQKLLNTVSTDQIEIILNGYISGLGNNEDTKKIRDTMERVITQGVKQVPEDTLKINKAKKHSEVTYTDGQYVDQGVIDGIDSKAPEVQKAVERLAKIVPLTLGSLWQVKSPSRVAKGLGNYFVLGLIKGLTKSTDELDTTTEGIATGLVDAFQNPFGTIAKIASGEIPYNPSIQPVLDTGYLATGVNGINSMFQSQQVELSGYSGQLAADISGVANQNDAIVAQLAQLREDMNDMTETILGMQIVLDSGAVVGELSDGFDYSLGVASTRKKRGN